MVNIVKILTYQKNKKAICETDKEIKKEILNWILWLNGQVKRGILDEMLN